MFPIASNSDDEKLYVDDVFSTWLYTGNGSTQTITNGIDLAGKGGMVWTKSRSLAQQNTIYDSARAWDAGGRLITNATDAAQDQSAGYFSASSTGFGLPTDVFNTAAATYASWTFRKAAKFFDVVTYTGNGSAGQTIAHSLGVAPGMIIIKRTDASGNDWAVWNAGAPALGGRLNQAAVFESGYFSSWCNSTAPTSSVFSVGADATVNASGGTYVAYLYAHDTSSTGIIQCGSFTTDGSGNATVNLGWEPQYVMVKCASSLANWAVFDNMRGMPVGNTNVARLFPNTTAAETLAADYDASPNATGFKFLATGYPSGTFIYMAIRRPNKPPTSGTQVFSPNVLTGTFANPIVTNFPIDMQISGRRNDVSSFISTRLTGANTVSTAWNTPSPMLFTNNTQAEVNSANGTNYWSNTGFLEFYYGNSSGAYVSWNFKRAPGFFDVVCYTGTGVARTITHNLTVAPELVIFKCRSSVGGWIAHCVYTPTYGIGYFFNLNTTAAQDASTWLTDNSQFTSTGINFQNGTFYVNGSGDTYVAYLFATLAGVSKVGSYTGNGSSQTINCGFAAGARFILIKRTDAAGDWYVWDTTRGIVTGNDPHLSLNSISIAEVTTDDSIDPYSPGFTVNQVAATDINVTSATYIFLAIS